MPRTLFVSHASEDAAATDRVVEYLERHGVTCWISSRDIPPRAIYAEAITAGMTDAQACAVIVSKAANGSAAIKRELELASRSRKPFIPIRIDDVEPGPGLDYYINNTQWVDVRREGERALDRIVRALAANEDAALAAGPAHAPSPLAATAKAAPASWRGKALAAAISAVLVVLIGLALMGQGGARVAAAPSSSSAAQEQQDRLRAEVAGARVERDAAMARAQAAERARADAQIHAAQAAARAPAPIVEQAVVDPVGSWSGFISVDQDSFTYVLNRDGTWLRRYTKTGQPSVSKGTWSLSGDELTLKGNVLTWRGRVRGTQWDGKVFDGDGSVFGTFAFTRD